MKDFFKKRTTLILWLAGLACTWPVYNKYWAPFDEGIVTVAAQMILAGKIPYRDFFMIIYPPGQIYLLAGLFKIFAGSLIAGRIYAVFVSVAIAMLSFFICRRLTGSLKASLFAYIIMLTSLAPRLGAIPSPIWPGVMLALASLHFLIRYIYSDARKTAWIAASGLAAGAGMAFRHDMAIFASAAILAPLGLVAAKEKSLKAVSVFIACVFLVMAPWTIYFARMSASKDMMESLFGFPFVHQASAAINLPKPCFDLNMIFHGSLYFINVNQYYIPAIAYAFIACLLFARLLRRELFRNVNLSLLAVALFGVFSYREAIMRADPAHLLTMISPAVIISAYIAHASFAGRFRPRPWAAIKYVTAVALSALLVLLVVKNIDKYLKNGYTKVFKKDIIITRFDRGSIYVPVEERAELLAALKFIGENTHPGEAIYVGNSVHWKDEFGGTLIFYYLADRLPAVKYYELMPGLVTSEKFQKEVSASLEAGKVRYLVLQDVDTAGLKREDVPRDKLILDDYISAKYSAAAKFGKYNIYKRK